MKTIARGMLVLCVAASLISCSSVKLNDVPVEDKSGSAMGVEGMGNTSVKSASADLQAKSLAALAGPQNVERVIYFDFDSYTLRADAQPVVTAHAEFLRNHKASKIAVEGNTDERGGSEYNLALGQKRADAVKKALNLLGVSDAQVESVSFGKEKPAVVGSDENAFAKNRRVELTYR